MCSTSLVHLLGLEPLLFHYLSRPSIIQTEVVKMRFTTPSPQKKTTKNNIHHLTLLESSHCSSYRGQMGVTCHFFLVSVKRHNFTVSPQHGFYMYGEYGTIFPNIPTWAYVIPFSLYGHKQCKHFKTPNSWLLANVITYFYHTTIHTVSTMEWSENRFRMKSRIGLKIARELTLRVIRYGHLTLSIKFCLLHDKFRMISEND